MARWIKCLLELLNEQEIKTSMIMSDGIKLSIQTQSSIWSIVQAFITGYNVTASRDLYFTEYQKENGDYLIVIKY